ncbi:hypothetical protein AJ80_05275 [Polytolypa hystricis UAMH7299]|uniref:Phosphatidylinositol-specific phospholipase C X domain-containing protein n=1 Tax=Polytolypa hystricis (strain UAMH7299) TaxID=1447883 RepID=A0A2B7Y5W2_POLH7|nr:hypothetical protein AJ80_05275 [Polytolypa hystricis UAMH7299]
MVVEHLTIRNLTATPITLTQLERFSPPDVSKPEARTLTRSLTTLLNNVTRSTSPVDVISDHAGAFSQQDVSVTIGPFCTEKTDIRVYEKSPNERLRLTFETEGGEKHQIQTPTRTSESATLKALVDQPRFRFTGIYITPESHLALYSSANLNAWMHELSDHTLTSALSIPGTHNSPTCHKAPPSVRCQAVSPREQLENGVRFFDIRLFPQYPNQPEKDNLVLVHSVFPISFMGNKYFKDLVREIDSFLERNPSETLIMSVKREGPGTHTDAQLSRILHHHYASPGSRWYTEPRIPHLGEVRGKIVLIRRFGLDESLKGEWNGRGWAIDASGWADNSPHATCPSGDICVQDFYEVLEMRNVEKKIEYINAHLSRSAQINYPPPTIAAAAAVAAAEEVSGAILKAEDHPPQNNVQQQQQTRLPFYVNFLSASNFWKMQTWPEKIAAKVNPATVDYLCRKHHQHHHHHHHHHHGGGGAADDDDDAGDWSTGILVCDWVGLDGDWDLVRCIVGMNTKLMMKQKQRDG